MAAIHDLIAQIVDARLRERIAAEWAKATRERKFGLVFEDHLRELLPLPEARPRKGDLVCLRCGSLKDLWRVQGFKGGLVQCLRPQPTVAGPRMPEARRRLYDRLRLATAKPADVPWTLPDSIDWRRIEGEVPGAGTLCRAAWRTVRPHPADSKAPDGRWRRAIHSA